MKFLATLALTALVGFAAAEEALEAANGCPTVTVEALADSCTQECGDDSCKFVSTVRNPCSCPRSIPTASLIMPCQADCPYNGCGVEFRTLQLPCDETTSSSSSSKTSTSRRWTWPSRPTTHFTTTTRAGPTSRPPTSRTSSSRTTRSTSTMSPPPVVTTRVTTLKPRPTTTTTSSTKAECPTVTRTTRPADCPVLRCPIPNCTFQEPLNVPCGCSGPKTILHVQGCPTGCPEGCATRTTTISESCPTGTRV